MVKGEVVNDTSLSLVAICQSDGLFSEITDWPGCRGAISCDAFPVPDSATTYLLPTQSQQVVEYEYAVYSCKDGAMLEGNIAEELSKCGKSKEKERLKMSYQIFFLLMGIKKGLS